MNQETTFSENKNSGVDWHRALVEEIDDLITVVGSDGTITYVSPTVTRTLGYDPEDLVGHDGYEFVHPEDRERNADAMQTVLSNPSTSKTVEVRFRHADGSWCWIEATIRNRLDDDIIGGILVSSREISERKKYETKSQELAEEYEALLNSAEDAIFLVSTKDSGEYPQFEFERLSPSYERQVGLSAEEIKGQTPREVFGEAQGAELEANYHRCMNVGEPISYQEELKLDEDARYWQTKLAPVVSDDEITHLVGITRNVTDCIERERRLRQQNERLDEFASVISHDLRNPLNVAQGRATLLAKQTESKHLDPLLEMLNRMESIVEDTLTLARQGDTISNTEPINLAEIVEECWAAVDTGDATVEIADVLTFQGDPDRVQHVFENLFRNAVEHGESDVTVRVGSQDTTGLYVEDDGPGVPTAKREDVLKPGHSSACGGTGFGLTIVKRIAEAHDWELSITEGTDGGARFEFEKVEYDAST